MVWVRVAFHENDGNHENDENDEDNSDSYKQGLELSAGFAEIWGHVLYWHLPLDLLSAPKLLLN